MVAASLMDLLKKNGFNWSQEADFAFGKLKDALTTTPVLRLPNFNIPFVIETDVSDVGIDAVLMQENKPIAFFSKKLGLKLQKGSTYIRELFAITEAIKKWRQYVLDRFFVIRTNQRSIKELFSQVILTPEQ